MIASHGAIIPLALAFPLPNAQQTTKMTIVEQTLSFFRNVHPALIFLLVPTLVILVHLVPWLVDPHGLRAFPGPWLARFSDLWLGRVAQRGHRSEVVHEMHEKYGTPIKPRLLRRTRETNPDIYDQGRLSASRPIIFPFRTPPRFKLFTPTATVP